MDQERALTTGLMRALPQAYAPFYHARGISISNEKAREQHRAYAQALGDAGVEVHTIPADEAFPDCVFVEDPAIVWNGRALMGHLAPHREGEQAPVEEALRRWHAIERMPAGARLEGGDVLHVGGTTYAGLTTRTNEEGVEALRRFLAAAGRRVVAAPIAKYLHLKTAVTYLGNGALVAVPDCGPLDAFEVDDVIYTDPGESAASNCLRVGRHLLIPRGNPRTEVRLRAFAQRHALQVVALDLSEFEKGEGSLTCLSILW